MMNEVTSMDCIKGIFKFFILIAITTVAVGALLS